MAVWSVVRKSELEGSSRTDAEYYQPYFLEVNNMLKKADAVPMKNVASCKHRKFKPIYGEFFKYIEIAEVNTTTGEINPIDILGENAPSRAQRIVKEGDVIVSTVRPIRNAVALISKEQNNYICSTGFAVMKPKNIYSEYLFAYLKTKYSIAQLVRKTTASMYPAVNEKDILNSLVVVLDEDIQKEIVKIINEFIFLLHQSKTLYSQAEQILLEELGLKDLDLKNDLFYTTNFKEIKDNNRMDAEYYIPKYEKLMRHIENYKEGYCKLLDIAKLINTNFDPIIEGEYFKYIELSDINASIGVIENTKEIMTVDAPSRARKKLKKGDVIVSSIKGSLDKTAMVTQDFDGVFASTGFFQFRPKIVDTAYLTVLIKSDIVYWQLFREASGAILSAVPKEALKNIIVPKIDKNLEDKLSEMVRISHEKYYESKNLLEQAKRKVEEMIEKEAGVK